MPFSWAIYGNQVRQKSSNSKQIQKKERDCQVNWIIRKKKIFRPLVKLLTHSDFSVRVNEVVQKRNFVSVDTRSGYDITQLSLTICLCAIVPVLVYFNEVPVSHCRNF